MRGYVHPLDYPCGLGHYLTREYVPVPYRPRPSTFHVEELVDWDRLGLDDRVGEYVVYRLVKSGLDTFTVLRRMSRWLGLPPSALIILGLKDRDASTTQYVFVKRSVLRSIPKAGSYPGFRYELYGFTHRRPRSTVLRGNRFRVVIRTGDPRGIEGLLRGIMDTITGRGLPAYYGYQRFGSVRFNSHLLGKYLLMNRLDLFLEELLHRLYPAEPRASLLSRIKGSYPGGLYYEHRVSRGGLRALRELYRRGRRLYTLLIDAYQSFLYNLLLNRVAVDRGWRGLDQDYPVPGCGGDLYRDLLSFEDVILPDGLPCWFRHGLFRPVDPCVKRREDGLELCFTLGRGFYASVVLREVFKHYYLIA